MGPALEIVQGLQQTEKAARLARARQYMIRVAKGATKPQIKQAVEALFHVSVLRVNTQSYQGKWRRLSGRWGRRPGWKRAIVTVAEGQKIEVK